MPKQLNPIARFEFRHTASKITRDDVIAWLKLYTKQWCFQLERGDSGYEHYQGQFSLIKKRRSDTILKICQFEHVKPVSNQVIDLYVTKEDTRISGPWKDTDKEFSQYIPWQYKLDRHQMYPYQNDIVKSLSVRDDRTINLLFDSKGCKGKSWLANIAELHFNGIVLPPVNDAEKLIYTAYDFTVGLGTHSPSFFIDLPKAMEQRKLAQMYTAIEIIKNGKLYDLRNKARVFWIDSPPIWVFTNTLPDFECLSVDRWKVWKIKHHCLIEIPITTAFEDENNFL